MQFILWNEWSQAFSCLRGAFSRQATFLWAALFCAGFTIKNSCRGISSIAECLGLKEKGYSSLLNLFHSDAVKLDKLQELWVKLCFKLFSPINIDGYMVLFGDGIKVGKEGKKMPAAKLMHQSSQSNSKAEYIMGHYIQAFSLAVLSCSGRIFAIPLLALIHDGLVYSNRSKETVHDRFSRAIQFISNAVQVPVIIVADAYYANKSIIHHMLAMGGHLVSRVAHNAVAYVPIEKPRKRQRGRPAIKGEKVILSTLFDKLDGAFDDFQYTYRDLYWPQAKRVIRFVACKHKTKGRIILMTTKLDLCPETVIKMYAKRWLIEMGFKTAIHEIGTFSYHFWMKEMKPTKRGQTKQYLHKESKDYREQVERKIRTYHIFLTLGCITQGLLLHLGLNHSKAVWKAFKGWLRTIRNDVEPSEIVVSNALQTSFPNYLRSKTLGFGWKNFLLEKCANESQGFEEKSAA